MSLTEKQWQASVKLIGSLNHSLDNRSNRLQAGQELLRLLNADHFASYLWNPQQACFDNACFINISSGNLKRYEQHYQFCDPITPKLQQSQQAISVNQVISQGQLLQTEFYNDFLARDGLYYGVNLYVFDEQGQNLGDFRVWRSRNKDNFEQDSLEILDLIAPHFRQSLLNSQQYQQLNREKLDYQAYQLTKREGSIVEALWQAGELQLNDQEIANKLSISIATLRTHIRHIYEKCQVKSRSGLWAKLRRRD